MRLLLASLFAALASMTLATATPALADSAGPNGESCDNGKGCGARGMAVTASCLFLGAGLVFAVRRDRA